MKNLLETFMKNHQKRLNRQILKCDKKDDKPCVKWKGYDNSFNTWINNSHVIDIIIYK